MKKASIYHKVYGRDADSIMSLGEKKASRILRCTFYSFITMRIITKKDNTYKNAAFVFFEHYHITEMEWRLEAALKCLARFSKRVLKVDVDAETIEYIEHSERKKSTSEIFAVNKKTKKLANRYDNSLPLFASF